MIDVGHPGDFRVKGQSGQRQEGLFSWVKKRNIEQAESFVVEVHIFPIFIHFILFCVLPGTFLSTAFELTGVFQALGLYYFLENGSDQTFISEIQSAK